MAHHCEYHHQEHEKSCSCEHHHHHHHHHEEGRGQLVKVVVAALLLIAAIWVEHQWQLPAWQLLLVYLIPYLIVGHRTLFEAFEGLWNGDPFNEHLLMSVATIGALSIGFVPGAETEFPEAVFVMLFFQVGELFEGYAEGRSRASISHLMDIRPDVAHVLELKDSATMTPSVETKGYDVLYRLESVRDFHPESVGVGSIIVVHKGEKIPLDGVVVDGTSQLNTMALTGESVLTEVSEGAEVYSGCINMGPRLLLRTTKSFGESTVSKILDLVEHASERKSQSEAFITRFARIYTPIVVCAAVLLAVLPPVLLSVVSQQSFIGTFPIWLYRALMFLVVSCPCALVLSVPLTFFGGIGSASRKGILIKGSNYIDVLAKLKTVVFDKTGTLTHGQVVERNEMMVEGKEASAKSNDGAVHSLVRGDNLKSDAVQALEQLRKEGVERIVMLSGDRREAVGKIADQLPLLTEWHAELLPQDKVKLLEQIMSEQHSSEKRSANGQSYVAFVGDGINDAPVLARADVGIAMGALGSDAAIEAADVVLMDDQPSKLAMAIALSRRTLSIARQNVWFAIGVKVAVLLLAACGLATMWMAVFADVGVTVLAVLNAMRA